MEKYPKDYFEFVQDKENIVDKALQTKQLTYFQDALSRFSKNKLNVVASYVLLFLVLMSIFVPIITPKELYTEINSKLITLPPRVPFVENLGIMDGTKFVENQPIDYDTIDPETGLGYPTVNYLVEYIDFDSLENYLQYGTDKTPQFVGGENLIYVDSDKTRFSIMTPELLQFTDSSELEIMVNEMSTTGDLEVYYSVFSATTIADNIASWGDLTLLGTYSSAGTYNIDISAMNLAPGYIILSHNLGSANTDSNQFISLDSINHTYFDGTETVTDEFSGYELSVFDMFVLDSDVENGRYNRENAVRTLASFKYDVYGALLADSYAKIGAEEYDEILANNPGMEDSITMVSETEWTFDEGYPISEVVGLDSITIAGTTYTNYQVMLSGRYELGLDSEPYYIFGTDTLGMDLFALIWLGLRTSLLLGTIATITNSFIGIIWGSISGYFGGQVDILMERFTDIWGSFPQITMIGIITSIIGTGFWALYIFLVYDGWIGAARVTRMQFYRFKNREYVLVARTLGASDKRIIFIHILPNALGTIVTRLILAIPSVIFLEVNLSYLGFGLGTGQTIPFGPIELSGTSIGVILKNGTSQIFVGNLWMIIYPTIIVAILMITFNIFGNALRDALNPQLRGN